MQSDVTVILTHLAHLFTLQLIKYGCSDVVRVLKLYKCNIIILLLFSVTESPEINKSKNLKNLSKQSYQLTCTVTL